VLGLGKIAGDQHLPAIVGSARFALAATVDWHRGGVAVPHYRSLDALLASGVALDAVVLCTPPQVREALAREALDAGLSVLLEKPPAGSVEALDALARHAVDRNRTLFAAWHSRFAPLVGAARDWLAGRELITGRVDWREDVRRWHPGQEWIWEPGGLGVFDPGINALSIVTAILPKPLFLTRATLTFPQNRQAPIAARLALSDTGGAPVAVDLDWRQTGPQTWDITVTTADGICALTSGGEALILPSGAQRGPNAEYSGLYRRFAALIRAGRSEVDLAPLQLVADAFMNGAREATEPFMD
jgi:D-galactose 1-dehydrogenase